MQTRCQPLYARGKSVRSTVLCLCLLSVFSPPAQEPKPKSIQVIPDWRWEAATAALQDPSPDVRHHAAQWLNSLSLDAFAPPAASRATLLSAALEPLILLTNSATWPEAALSEIKWGQRPGSISPRRVTELLKHPEERIRLAAAEALGRMGPAAASIAPEVADLLKDSDSGVQFYAGTALGKMGVAAANATLPVVQSLTHSNINIRSAAADALEKMDAVSANVVADVGNLLGDSNAGVRSAAAEALGKIGTNAAPFASHLGKLLDDPSPAVRSSVARALGEIGLAATNFTPQLVALLKNPNGAVRSSAAEALGNMGAAATSAVPDLLTLFEDADERARHGAAEALGKIGAAEPGLPARLADLLKHPQSSIRYHATQALEAMATTATKFAPQLAERLRDSDSGVRFAAGNALGAMGPAAAGVASQVAEILNDSDPVFRRSAAYALRCLGPNARSVAPQIAALFKESDYHLRYYAAEALSYMGADAAAFTEPLAERLNDSGVAVRTFAATALGHLGPIAAGAIPELAKLLQHPDSALRNAATQALERIVAEPNPTAALALIDASHGNTQIRSFLIFWAYMIAGNSEPNLSRTIWLASREVDAGSKIDALNHTETTGLFTNLLGTFQAAQNLPALRRSIAQLAANLARVRKPIATLDQNCVRDLRDAMKKEFPDQARTLDDALQEYKWPRSALMVVAGHVSFWVLLIFFYPSSPMIQAIFFWNKWTRKIFGMGYVGAAITVVPFLRRRLFQPFKDSLVPFRYVDDFDAESYFAQSEVIEETKPNHPGKRQRLLDAIGQVKGQILLRGQSGLGKSLLLQRLALHSRSTLVFLRATECANGVVAAIQRRLQGQARDETYLRTLIYAGALDVMIDGLNEASPDARSRISQFVEEHFKGNFVITTQPLQWTPPATIRVLQLQPLRPDQIREFMIGRWKALQGVATLSEKDYETAVDLYLSDLPQASTDIQDADPKLVILCNPMEARLAAELLAQGEPSPDPFRLVQRRFEIAAKSFREKNGRDFPCDSFAERVYEWRKSDRADISVDCFEIEAAELAEHRLMIQRTDTIRKAQGEEERTRWFFRHDRIMEFFLYPAFGTSTQRARRLNQIEDERFWGVYELLAQHLPGAAEDELYAFLNEWSATTNQNDLRNRYELARKRRKRNESYTQLLRRKSSPGPQPKEDPFSSF